jgi:ATP-dependent Lon protease
MKNGGTTEYMKFKQYIDMFESIPFGKNLKMPFSGLDTHDKKCEFLENARNDLDSKIYGHQSSKQELIRLLAKWMISDTHTGCVIGLHGSPGIGKTKFLKNVISPVLERPVHYISLAGMSDGGFIDGFDYAYEGACCGRIIEAVIRTKCMNPIIFFDELDKVSKTREGAEIIGKLINLTDSTQNNSILDRYFRGINFDLSKAIFVFSFNDIANIDPVLLNRIKVINVPNYDYNDKVEIFNKFLLPIACKEYAIKPENLVFSGDALQVLIRSSEEPGVRYLQRALDTIISNLTVMRFSKKCKINFDKSIKVNKETLMKLLN